MRKNSHVYIVTLAALLLSVQTFAFAKGTGDQTQQRDQDRVQDPATHDGDEPDQDRDRLRDQDRIQDPVGDYLLGAYGVNAGSAEAASTATQLRAILQQRSGDTTTPQEQEREQLRFTAENDNAIRLGAYAFEAARGLLGAPGEGLARSAAQVAASTTEALRAEEHTRNRSSFIRFWAGAPDDDVALLTRVAEQNRVRLEEMRQELEACPCDEETRTILREQLRLMLEEQERISQFADEQDAVKGFFARLFGR